MLISLLAVWGGGLFLFILPTVLYQNLREP
jgi:hypothetical protein